MQKRHLRRLVKKLFWEQRRDRLLDSLLKAAECKADHEAAQLVSGRIRRVLTIKRMHITV